MVLFLINFKSLLNLAKVLIKEPLSNNVAFSEHSTFEE